MSNINPISDLEYDPRSGQYRYNARLSWPLQHQHQHQQRQHQNPTPLLPPQDMTPRRSSSPLSVPFESNTYHHHHHHHHTATYPPTTSAAATMMDSHQHPHHQQQQQQHQHWHIPTHTQVSYPLDTAYTQHAFTTYDTSFQASPSEYTTQHPLMDPASFGGNLQAGVNVTMAGAMNVGMSMDDVFHTMALTNPMTMTAGLQPSLEQLGLSLSWSTDLSNLYEYEIPGMIAPHHQLAGSPVAGSETYTSETLSLRSWEHIDHPDHQTDAIFNPEMTLHPRTFSDSSASDNEQHSRTSLDGFVDVAHSISSPSNDSAGEPYSDQDYHFESARRSSPNVFTGPIIIPQPKNNTPIGTSPTQRSSTSPTTRGSRPRKSTGTSRAGTSSKGVTKKTPAAAPKEGEKRVGRRKGPLREDQRKQASEIRKLGACIRCRFLKKTCDPGNPCNGCQPSHARLWMVPCTRIDIKDLGYFIKDWKADYDRHICLGYSVANIKSMSEKEEILCVTHGYGPVLVVPAREVYVRDDRALGVNWIEADHNGVMSAHEVETAQLALGSAGISPAMISAYLDQHIDDNFEGFVDDFFMGSPFFPEILKIVHRYWLKEKTPVIRTALKFVVAYNLTQAICLMQPIGERQENFPGAIPVDSQHHNQGRIVAPVMINFEVKCAMAEQWRALQQEVLQELSTLYTRVYSKDKLKHWPTIFMIASVLLVVWEEMQFDCHYRIPDEQVVSKFCQEMVDTPVGVVIGLFSAISQKIPSFVEWDTPKHKESLNSEPSVCKAMEEVRDEIKRNEPYLRCRSDAQFDRNDFDSLSNMFVSKLVIRAH